MSEPATKITLDLTSAARKYSYQSLVEGLELDEGTTADTIHAASLSDLKIVSTNLNNEINNLRVDKDIVRRAAVIVSKEIVDEAIIIKESE